MMALAWSSCMHIIAQRHHYSGVITGAIASQITRLTRLLTQRFVQVQIKETTNKIDLLHPFFEYHTSVNSGGESMDWKLCIDYQRTSYSLIFAYVMMDLCWSSCTHSIDQRHHCSDVIMGAIASQITSLTIVYTTVYSGADQRKISKLCITGRFTGDRWIPHTNGHQDIHVHHLVIAMQASMYQNI